jgi:hypothetical protein
MSTVGDPVVFEVEIHTKKAFNIKRPKELK